MPAAVLPQASAGRLVADTARSLQAIGIPSPTVGQGLRRTAWPGRFEIVRGRPPVILDGAHNGASAVALARALRAEQGRRRLVLIVGINADKDARAVLRPLAGVATAIVATRSSSPRAAESADVARIVRSTSHRSVEIVPDIETALPVARTRAGANGLVCVTGSLALVGDARTALGRAPAERLW